MLRNLHIKNLALIREVDVDFTDGLNILTGETGAGKSIIVDSIGLALGGRVQRDLTRGGTGVSLVELVFEIQNDETIEALRRFEIEADDGVVVISRSCRSVPRSLRTATPVPILVIQRFCSPFRFSASLRWRSGRSGRWYSASPIPHSLGLT